MPGTNRSRRNDLFVDTSGWVFYLDRDDPKNDASVVEVVHIDHNLDKEAWELLEKYSDKEWSLVDASSFLIMRRFGMTSVLTGDHHFDQVGFGFKLLPY